MKTKLAWGASMSALLTPFAAFADFGMMGSGMGGGWYGGLTWIVWTAVGVLAAVWLWQQISKK